MFAEVGLFILGIVGLWLGAELTVHAARKISARFGISQTFFGLTVLSIGTSFPEMFTHIIASANILANPSLIQKFSDLSIGTNIGSNIVQITFILGLLGVITRVHSNKKIMKFDYIVMLLGIVALFVLGFNGVISRIEGIALVLAYIIYLWYLTTREISHWKSGNGKKRFLKVKKGNFLTKQSAYLIIGLALLAFSASIVLKNGSILADLLGIADTVVGVVFIGIGTVLPEFTTALVALLKKAQGISLGTLVGSNITNPLLALGIGAIISPYLMDASFLFYDLIFWFVISLVVMYFFYKGFKLFRWEGIFLMVAYVAFVWVRVAVFG